MHFSVQIKSYNKIKIKIATTPLEGSDECLII